MRLVRRVLKNIIIPFLIIVLLLLAYLRYHDGLLQSIYGFLALALITGFVLGAYMAVAGND